MVIGSAGVRKTVGFGIAPEIKNGILIGGHSDFRVNGNRVAISIGDMVSIAGNYRLSLLCHSSLGSHKLCKYVSELG